MRRDNNTIAHKTTIMTATINESSLNNVFTFFISYKDIQTFVSTDTCTYANMISWAK